MDEALTSEAKATGTKWCAARELPEERRTATPFNRTLSEIVDRRLRGLEPDLIAFGADTRRRCAFCTLGSVAARRLRDPPANHLPPGHP